MGYRDKEKKRLADKRYSEKHKEELNLKKKEYYQKNREAVLQRTKKYAQENSASIKKYHKGYHEKKRLEVLAKIDHAMKCANCGCDDTRYLEINHIKGGGKKEQKKHGATQNLVGLIQQGERGIDDLNLLCRPCNALDHLERVNGKLSFRVVWDKPVAV